MKLWNLNEKKDSTFFPHWDGWSDRGSKSYKLSIGWYRLGYRWVLPIFLQKHAKARFKHAWAVWRHPKRHAKKKESEALSETDGLCSSEHGLRWITGYRFWKFRWAASKFKATSYYSVHPIILSATHIKTIQKQVYKNQFRIVVSWFPFSFNVPEQFMYCPGSNLDFISLTSSTQHQLQTNNDSKVQKHSPIPPKSNHANTLWITPTSFIQKNPLNFPSCMFGH